MDFNDNRLNTEGAELDMCVADAVVAKDPSERLYAIKKIIQKQQKAATDAFLKIVSELDTARPHLRASTLKSFLISDQLGTAPDHC